MRGDEIELILNTSKIKASRLIAHQKVNYYSGHTEPVTLYPHSSLTGFSWNAEILDQLCFQATSQEQAYITKGTFKFPYETYRDNQDY